MSLRAALRGACRLGAVLAVVGAMTVPAAAQPGCDASVDSAWLLAAPDARGGVSVDAALVRPVVADLGAAVGLLARTAVVALDADGVRRFLGPAAAPAPGGRVLRAYLVRAVFPVARPSLALQWRGDDLHVAAFGLGCAPFTEHPLVVFLDRRPARVFVSASAAL